PRCWRSGRRWRRTRRSSGAGTAPTAARSGCTWRGRRARSRRIRRTGRWSSRSSIAAVAVATALFPPQSRDWALPGEVPLTPRAAERLARESAVQPFDNAARALCIDWRLGSLDGKQVQRWGEALGASLVKKRDAEVLAYDQGQRPQCPANEPQLLVVGMDGGRYQS